MDIIKESNLFILHLKVFLTVHFLWVHTLYIRFYSFNISYPVYSMGMYEIC